MLKEFYVIKNLLENFLALNFSTFVIIFFIRNLSSHFILRHGLLWLCVMVRHINVIFEINDHKSVSFINLCNALYFI